MEIISPETLRLSESSEIKGGYKGIRNGERKVY